MSLERDSGAPKAQPAALELPVQCCVRSATLGYTSRGAASRKRDRILESRRLLQCLRIRKVVEKLEEVQKRATEMTQGPKKMPCSES